MILKVIPLKLFLVMVSSPPLINVTTRVDVTTPGDNVATLGDNVTTCTAKMFWLACAREQTPLYFVGYF